MLPTSSRRLVHDEDPRLTGRRVIANLFDVEASGGLLFSKLEHDIRFFGAARVSGIGDADEATAWAEVGVGVAECAVGRGWLRDNGGIATGQVAEIEDCDTHLTALGRRQDVDQLRVAAKV